MLVIQTGTIIFPAPSDPCDANILITVVGKSCIDKVFIRTNKFISFDISFAVLSFSILFIASIPAGVAAFPIPIKFETIFKVINFLTSSLVFLKNLLTNGLKIFSIFPNILVFFIIFIIPLQKHKIPPNLKIKSITFSKLTNTAEFTFSTF